jgi:hypothetical protein
MATEKNRIDRDPTLSTNKKHAKTGFKELFSPSPQGLPLWPAIAAFLFPYSWMDN